MSAESSPTELLFRHDAYARSCPARIVEVTPEGGIILDRTVFYAQGGGQPGDTGVLRRQDGSEIALGETRYAPDRLHVAHVPRPGSTPPTIGEAVEAVLDWEPRYARMRVHTALHLLSVVLPYPVTGGSIGDGEGRLDFDIPEGGLDRDEIAAKLAALVARNASVADRWISDAELDANPSLVKTMSVKPPRGSGRIRLVEIDGIDLQPCGGTHVCRTGEIGRIEIAAIEKKGKQNRRVRIRLA